MVGEMRRIALTTVILLALAAGMTQASQPVLIDDFEAGIGAWATNDGLVAGHGPGKLCGIYTVGESAPDGGKQAGMVEFLVGDRTWASVTIHIDGSQWAQADCTRLSLWLRGDGSDDDVEVVLRALYDRPDNADVAYRQSVSLDSKGWQKIGLRLLGFVDDDGHPLTQEEVRHLALLQFVKTGSWQSCRFYVDEIHAKSEDVSELREDVLEVDFSRSSGRVRLQLGCNFAGAAALATASHEKQTTLGSVIHALSLCVVRFVLDDYLQREQEQYDTALLEQHIDFIQCQGAKALICLHAPRPQPGDDFQKTQRLRELFTTTVRSLVDLWATEPRGRYYEVLNEPLLRSGIATAHDLAGAYNALAKEIAAVGSEALIGGPGLASPWGDHLPEFVQAADRLSFLSYHFWGGHTPVVATSQLLTAARTGRAPDLPDQLSFAAVKAASRGRSVEVFITQAGVNSAATNAEQTPSEHFAGSWLAMAALSAAPYIDKLLYTPLVGGQIGFINSAGQPSAVYRAAWLMRTYMPRGSQLCHWLYPDSQTVAAAIRTATANNVIVAYGGEAPRTLTIRAQGTERPKLVRARKVDSSAEQIQFLDLPLATEQTIELSGPGVAVVQFIQ